ncbi:SCO family protein [Comamonas endophytica]|uniref:SCO family protein n=2 Tax=Comamonas endophytica TaxID=2949090 RepID=A0ABY6G805_9BURK|nr:MULTISPECIES: SCO family protein [unclassified Acidovorax]MCD2511323.1 SCO family protein [Acidovorax sp. D4N7]UYG50717.1 SCO family protein [Acidovorax sp. 5MLIR]
MEKRLFLKGALASALGIGMAGVLAGCSRETKASFQGVDVTGAEYARDFSLPDAQGRQRTLKDFAGKVVVVFFGYTQCPDVCPTSLQELAEAKRQLGAEGDRLQGVFVTLDPERDQPEVLKAYMESFDPSFVALRGTPEQTAAMAKDFKIFYKKVEGRTPQSYTLDHSAGSYVYDTQGRLRVYQRYGSGPQVLTADVKALLTEKA